MSDFKIVSLLNPGGVNFFSGVLGLSAGTTQITTGTVHFSNSNGVSFGANGQTVTASHDGITSQSNQAFSAGGGSSAFQTLNFRNANGISFSNSLGSVEASYTVPTVPAQFSGGNSNLGNTAGDTGVVTGRVVLVGTNNITLSGSTNGGSMTISISGGAGGAGNTGSISAGTTRATLGEVIFSNSNGLAFGVNGQTVTGSYTVPTITSWTASDNATSITVARLAFTNLNGMTLSLSTTTGGSATVVGSYTQDTTPPIATNVNDVATAGSTGTVTRFAPEDHRHAGIVRVGVSNTGNTLGNTGASHGQFIFAASGGITASMSTGAGGTHTIWHSVANPVAQTNQTLGGYFVGNTTGQSSSSTWDARTLSIDGAGIVSAGWSAGSIRISATQSNQAFSAAGGSSAFQTLSFSDNAQASWTNNAGQVALTDVRASLFATGNTTQSSSGTQNIDALTFRGDGVASVGVSNGSVVISVPAGGGAGFSGGMSNLGNTLGTSGTVASEIVFVGSNNITLSQSVNGNSATISISAAAGGAPTPISYYENSPRGATSTVSIANGTLYVQPFVVPSPISAYRLHMLQQVTTQATLTQSFSGRVSASAGSSGGTGQVGYSGTVLLFSRKETGTGASSSQLVSFFSNTYSHQLGMSMTGSNSTAASSATLRWTTSAAMTFVSQVNSLGVAVTGSYGSSSSGSFTSTSTAGNSFTSNAGTMSFGSQVMSGVRPIMVPFGTSLSAGEYWLGHIVSSSSASSTYSLQRLLDFGASIGRVFYTSNTSGFARLGSTATIASSNIQEGWGSYSASSQTTTTIPVSQISNMSQFQTWFNMMAAVS